MFKALQPEKVFTTLKAESQKQNGLTDRLFRAQ